MSWRVIIDRVPAALLIAALEEAGETGPAAGRCRMANRRFRELLGYDAGEIGDVGRWLQRVQTHRHVPPIGAGRLRPPARGGAADRRSFQARIVRKDGQARWFEIGIARCDGAAAPLCAMVFTDITERMRTRRRLDRLARTDALTGTLTRQSLLERHATTLAAGRVGYDVLLCGIDGLGRINERAGQAGGDAVLAACAVRLRRLAGRHALVARWEGDRFLIVLPGRGRSALRRLASRIARGPAGDDAREPGDRPVTLTIGGACMAAGTPIAEAVRRAAGALAFGKSAGGNRIELD